MHENVILKSRDGVETDGRFELALVALGGIDGGVGRGACDDEEFLDVVRVPGTDEMATNGPRLMGSGVLAGESVTPFVRFEATTVRDATGFGGRGGAGVAGSVGWRRSLVRGFGGSGGGGNGDTDADVSDRFRMAAYVSGVAAVVRGFGGSVRLDVVVDDDLDEAGWAPDKRADERLTVACLSGALRTKGVVVVEVVGAG